jgi:DNA end-binding protein Ku
MHTLRFHDEVVSGDELELDGSGRKPSGREVEMAGQLLKSMAEDFKPERYEDTYRDAVLDLIKRKGKGEEIDLVAEEEPAHGDDLAAALKASLAGSRS